MSGRLYKNLESLEVLEQLESNTYDFIYLDVPYYSGAKDFYLLSDKTSIKKHISTIKNVPISEVTQKEVEEERTKIENEELKKYSQYISKVIENAHRLIKENGVVAFLCPSHEYANINYRLILDQFFPSFKVITIEKRRKTLQTTHDNNYNLFFYSPISNFVFPELKELRPVEEFTYKDDYDYYKKYPAIQIGARKPSMEYEWHGIIPSENKSWRYSREKMDKMYSDGRIIVDDNRAWIKYYRSEHPEVVSSVWKYNDKGGFSPFIDAQSIERMFSMFVSSTSRILCPYERDGRFTLFADNFGVDWESIYLPYGHGEDYILEIPESHYEVILEIQKNKLRDYKDNVITNVGDIDELRVRFENLSLDVKMIQSSIGLDDSELSIDAVIDKIHQTVTEAFSSLSIDGCIPEAQEWVNPYWDKLEQESKHFIPTGLLLYKQINSIPGVDLAPIMIEYCKALEKELFKKIYYGYIRNIIDREINLRVVFPEAFSCNSTSVFVGFLNTCVTTKRDRPDEWKFEFGKMAYVLQSALSRHPREPIIIDFREYLNRNFEQQFFMEQFTDRLNDITKLRNVCAHPSIISNEDVEDGKELIRQKMLLLLKYHTE